MNPNAQSRPQSAAVDGDLLSHERLDAYRVAVEFRGFAQTLIVRLPKVKGQLGDQLERASESIVLRIAEGAGCEWRSPEQKRHFRGARGSVLECSACLDICRIRKVGSADQLTGGRLLLLRLAQMLTRLCREG